MSYEKPKTFRVIGSIPYPINAEIDKYAALAGMSKTQFLGILIQLGLNSWIRAYSPEKLLDAEMTGKLLEALGITKEFEGGVDASKLLPSS